MTAVLAPAAIPLTPLPPRPLNLPPRRLTPPRRPALRPRTPRYAYLADFSFSDAFDENGYLKGVTATDYVTLPDDYADITISADLGQVSDDDINDYIDSNVLSNLRPRMSQGPRSRGRRYGHH